jgi:4-amino-4-deoxy-L-arabinose transferase-like glycosyltransferase
MAKRSKKKSKKKETVEFDFTRIFDRFTSFSTYDKLAIGLVIFALILRIFLSPHCFWIDEAREMAISRNLMRGQGYTLYGEHYVQHPYVFYTLIGISSIVFGMVDFAGMAVSILAGTLSVLAIYLLGKETFNERVGIISALLLNFHPLHLFYSTRVINDVTMVLFVVLAMYFFVRFNRRSEWSSLYLASGFTALAVLTKIVAIVLPPVLLLYLIFKKRLTWINQKEYWYAIIPFLILFGIYMVINITALGEVFPLTYYLGRFAPSGVDVGPPTYYLENFLSIVRWPIAIAFVWGVLCAFLMKLRNSRFLLLWIAVFFVTISFQSDKVDRYMIPIFPQIIIFGALGMDKLLRDFKNSGYVIYGAVGIVLLLFSYTLYSDAAVLIPGLSQGFCGFDETGDWIQQVTSQDAPLMVGSDNQIAWYADRENIHHFPREIDDFYTYLYENQIALLVVDRWERTQPSYVYEYNEQGAAFWYPLFLNDTRLQFVNVIAWNDQPVSFIYFVNMSA